MRTLFTVIFFCVAISLSHAQSPCDKIKYLDKLAMAPGELPVQDFKLFDYNQIPDSVKELKGVGIVFEGVDGSVQFRFANTINAPGKNGV